MAHLCLTSAPPLHIVINSHMFAIQKLLETRGKMELGKKTNKRQNVCGTEVNLPRQMVQSLTFGQG